MEKRRKFTFLILLVSIGITNTLGDSQRARTKELSETSENEQSPLVYSLHTESGRRSPRRSMKVLKRRHALRNRADSNQNYNQDQNQQQPQQQYSYQQQQNPYQQQQNPYQQQQYPYQQGYNQPQYNPFPSFYNQPQSQFPFSFPFQNPNTPSHINNLFYQNTPNFPFFQQPFGAFPIGPFIIIQVPYCPQDKSTPTKPTTDTPNIETGVRIRPEEPPELDESLYSTGISLDAIPPVRPPSVTAPPVWRQTNTSNASSLKKSNVPASTRRPSVNRRTTTTTTTQAPESADSGCVKAIISCCTPEMDMTCFEENDCPFIFDDPCQDLREAASQIAKKSTMGN